MITFYQRSFPHSIGGRDHNTNSCQRRGNLHFHIAVNLQIDTSSQCLSVGRVIVIARALNPKNLRNERNSANHCSYFVKDVVDLSTDLGIGCSAELAVDSSICHRCCCCYIGQITMIKIFCRSIDWASIVSSESTGLEMAAASTENRGLIQTEMVQINQISLSMDSDYIDR
jgi:hypothetical protein